MRSRLVAFGCSNTFGHGLEDCYNKENNGPSWKPSKFAWPNILAEKLDRQCINLSVPGSSNKIIWHTLLNTSFRFNDVVFVLWTFPERYCIITDNEGNHEEIALFHKTRASKSFYKYLHNETDMNVDLNNRISHSCLYLKSIGIKSYHAIYNYRDLTQLDWNAVPMLQTSFKDIQQKHPRALDKVHPGHEAHKEYARQLYKEITEKQ